MSKINKVLKQTRRYTLVRHKANDGRVLLSKVLNKTDKTVWTKEIEYDG